MPVNFLNMAIKAEELEYPNSLATGFDGAARFKQSHGFDDAHAVVPLCLRYFQILMALASQCPLRDPCLAGEFGRATAVLRVFFQMIEKRTKDGVVGRRQERSRDGGGFQFTQKGAQKALMLFTSKITSICARLVQQRAHEGGDQQGLRPRRQALAQLVDDIEGCLKDFAAIEPNVRHVRRQPHAEIT